MSLYLQLPFVCHSTIEYFKTTEEDVAKYRKLLLNHKTIYEILDYVKNNYELIESNNIDRYKIEDNGVTISFKDLDIIGIAYQIATSNNNKIIKIELLSEDIVIKTINNPELVTNRNNKNYYNINGDIGVIPWYLSYFKIKIYLEQPTKPEDIYITSRNYDIVMRYVFVTLYQSNDYETMKVLNYHERDLN